MMQDGGMNIMNHEKHTNILVNQANANPRQSTDHSRNLQHPFTSSVVLTHGERGVLRKNPRFFFPILVNHMNRTRSTTVCDFVLKLVMESQREFEIDIFSTAQVILIHKC